ncbi:hypothetical protein HHI36_005683 [Cryptolaemus montrouzieri]|uniref:PiggyBac transposable element-derived protein domain-containing protein n=1 Tax=Cryptolaemus montrouzieri TaxID=559131 RepID=A0ABD2NUU4_9CUCU
MDPTNKVYKIQPLIDKVNNVSQSLFQPMGRSFSLDEAMEPYYGHYRMKQFVKPYNFWYPTTSEGYLLKFSSYCGAGDKVKGKTLGFSVTEKLCGGYIPLGSTVDNFFCSIPFL